MSVSFILLLYQRIQNDDTYIENSLKDEMEKVFLFTERRAEVGKKLENTIYVTVGIPKGEGILQSIDHALSEGDFVELKRSKA